MVGKAVSPLLKRAKFDVCSLCVVVMNCKNIRRGVGLPLPKYHCNFKNNLIELLCKINYDLPLILNSFKAFRKLQTLMQREGQAHSPTKSERDSAENLIDGGVGKQSLRLYGRKVW